MTIALDTGGRKAPAMLPTATLIAGLPRGLDLAVIAVSGFLVYGIHPYPRLGEIGSHYPAAIAVALLIAASLFQWFGAYGSGEGLPGGAPRLRRLLAAWAVTFGLLLLLAFALKISSDFSRIWAFAWFCTAFAGLGAGRRGLDLWMARSIREGRFASRAVIVGAADLGHRLAAHLRAAGDAPLALLGFVDDRNTRADCGNTGLTLLGDSDRLIELIRRDQVDLVIIALPWSAGARLRALVHRLAMTPVQIRLAPDRAGFEFAGRRYATLAGLPMLHLFDRPISGWSQVTKAVEDRILAALMLLLLAPVMALIAVAVRLDSPGPVLFRQMRAGFNNRPFEVLKFRTMHHGAADREGAVLTRRNDPRVTRVGRVLRRFSLDELPQLFNVLRGEMSLVGPRPHARAASAAGRDYAELVEAYAARHRVKPGITGWAQVRGWRGETDTVEKLRRRVEHDLAYIDNWSVWLDLEILGRTLLVVLRGDQAV